MRVVRLGRAFGVIDARTGFGTLRGALDGRVLEQWRGDGPGWVLVRVESDTSYARALAGMVHELERRLEPWRARDSLDRAVQTSDRAAALTPATAFVVMESASRWETLARADAKARGAHEHLEMAVTPEAGTVFLLGGGLVALACVRRRAPRD